VPPDVAPEDVRNTVSAAAAKTDGKPPGRPYAERVVLVRDTALRYDRMLHIGLYSGEPATFSAIETVPTSTGIRREPRHAEDSCRNPDRTDGTGSARSH
jgi:hypothetical protein